MGLQRVLAATVLTIAATAVAATSRLDIIDLPTGFFPEGITLAEEWTVYVGSFNEGERDIILSRRIVFHSLLFILRGRVYVICCSG